MLKRRTPMCRHPRGAGRRDVEPADPLKSIRESVAKAAECGQDEGNR